MTRKITRRTLLRGAGAAMALPLLEAMTPLSFSARAASQESSSPRRMMFVYVPNGAVMEHWTPQAEGAGFTLPSILAPLAPHQSDLLVISGLAHQHGEANGDGPGDHARASGSYLTGAQPRKTASVDIRVGVSVDQVAARRLGEHTRFASLELGCDKGKQAGSCDSGYSCAYQFNLAWKTPTMPLPPEVDPRLVFQRMFGEETGASLSQIAGSTETPNDAATKANRRSVLDFVREDAGRLRRDLGRRDKLKLDQYLDSVREIERRIERSEDVKAQLPPGADPIDDVPEDYAHHIRLMFDLAALAFQTDSTRVITLMIAHDGSNRSYPFIGVPDGHHDLSHHGGNQEKQDKIAKINRFHAEQFAYFLEKLKSIREGEGALLDQCLIAYGSGLSDGDAHDHHNLPLVLAGRGGGSVQPSRHLRCEDRTPMSNLFVAMLQAVGVDADRFADSTGTLKLTV
jgi:hypothetical protein